MDTAQLKAIWNREAQRSHVGWDFSHLQGRCASTALPWDYRTWVNRWRTPDTQLLDMGTGGGEFLLTLQHPPENTAVTEGYPPNLSLCRKRLTPLGITVREITREDAVPYPDAAFDLVINRHESFSAREVVRILRPGGHFVTQQVGGSNHADLSRRLLPDYRPAHPEHHLEPVSRQVSDAGLEIIQQDECFPVVSYFDVGALVLMASMISWEFPGFSVEGCFHRLLQLQHELESTGAVTGTEHRFLIAAAKSG